MRQRRLADDVVADHPSRGVPKTTLRFAGDPARHVAARVPGATGTAALESRRLEEQVRVEAIGLAPLMFGMVTTVLVGVLVTSDRSTLRNAWVALTATLVVFCAGVHGARLLRRPDADTLRRDTLVVVFGCLALLAAMACFPWISNPRSAAAQQIEVFLVGTAIVSAAAVFAGLPGLTWAPVAVPTSWIVGALLDGTRSEAERLASLVPVLIVISLTIVVTVAVRHVRFGASRAAIDAEVRLAELAMARDAAQQADRDKSRFLAIASHDLRQPLHALGLFAAALENRLRGSANEQVVSDMVQSIDGLNRSFNAIMDVSQLDAGAIRPNVQRFPLRDLFRRLHMHYAGQAELAGLALRFSPGGKSVTSDPQLLERIVGNLIQNAIKYTVDGGVVVVARTTTTHFNIEVWDTGLGIPAPELPRIFHEFYQIGGNERVRMRGLGIGLAIVKRLALLLGHDLTVTSVPGRGSMFRLGIATGSLSEIEDVTAAADTLPMPLSGQRTALIVDDDEAIRDGLDLLLSEWGYQSVAASGLDQARYVLRLLESAPDVILCDLHLGDGPDGFAVIDAIRRQCGREVPAILITGDASSDDVARAVDGEFMILSKPVQPRTLRNALRALEEGS